MVHEGDRPLQKNKHGTMIWTADVLCLVVAAIWGSGFIASQIAIDANMSAALIMVLRFTVAAAVMLVVCLPKLKRIRLIDLKMGGLFSTCLCYFLQTFAQKHTTPAQAGVLLSTEGLFGSLFSVLLGLEIVSVNLIIGGVIIMASIILTELLPSKAEKEM